SDVTVALSNMNSITTYISYLTEQAEQAVEIVQQKESTSPVTPTTQQSEPDEAEFFSSNESDSDPTEDNSDNSHPDGNKQLPKTVCLDLSLNFEELSVTGILEKVAFNQTLKGGRKTAYFGNLPYSYGAITHQACPYPQCDIFDGIFGKLQTVVGMDFTPENYTCLINLYEHGGVSIPKHSDDESQILPDSQIYTISIGATRVMRFVNSTGKIMETDVSLKHGSVFVMDAASQKDWAHCLLPDRMENNPRISLTFRRLRDTSDLPAPVQTKVPPIKPPEPLKPRIAQGTHRRILFLTDSILKHTPESLFDRIGGQGKYRCVKKINYELSNVFNYEPEFKYTDIVVISSGTNDLARFGKRPEVLADLVTRRLRECCARNRDTTFVFTALTSTAYGWLNRAIGSFNRIMFDLATQLPNMAFFDTHQVLLRSPISKPWSRVPVLRPNDDGVHLTFEARRLVTSQLINGLGVIVLGREGRPVEDRLHGWNWPLRYAYYVSSLPTGRSKFSTFVKKGIS
ncbi:MAG: hypothetical protein GY774_16325, partial [Planctomycetes bacterium]|nr:hypothetical protein [Planctomycetota bacterium]